ncbi:MAG: cytochrome c3 family protein, partial [Thermoanaerobaculia bacterium]|nr:cytochrome c3 family protein [Thermoanaerobaculia bacterium]
TAALAQRAAAPETSCIACHGNVELFGEEGAELVRGFAEGVHAKVGLSCHDCHGGNPDPALAEDVDAAMDPGYGEAPYLGVVARRVQPALCGVCHSDPTFMRRYKPDARVDQEHEYWASQHGLAVRQGSDRAAVCVDCHGVHGILRPADPDAPVYPTRVAETCARCHADPERMAGVVLADGRPLPVDQYARWSRSVHASSLLERGDLFAPTCNDCHGNHGAVPPGLDSIAFVCGQCHGREAELFRASGKHQAFEEHREYLEAAGEDGCAACHEEPEPAAGVTTPHALTECSSCHRNHAVVRPTLAMLVPLPETPCAFCHEGPVAEGEEDAGVDDAQSGDATATAALGEPVVPAEGGRYPEEKARLLATGAEAGLSGDALFDWLVDRALDLPWHTEQGSQGEPRLRPEFGRLYAKFRIGKTHTTYVDPASGESVELPVVRCGDCHAAEPLLADEPIGLGASARMLDAIRELTSLTARADRSLLAARRGGVHRGEGPLELDRAVEAQIRLEVLLHGFPTGEGGPFA